MHHSLNITTTTESDTLTVTLSGELDADNCQALAAAVDPTTKSVELDLEALNFVDSSGITEILRLREQVVQGGGQFAIQAVSPQVRKVLEITGLTDYLSVAGGTASGDD